MAHFSHWTGNVADTYARGWPRRKQVLAIPTRFCGLIDTYRRREGIVQSRMRGRE
jgi:hypothetical protein